MPLAVTGPNYRVEITEAPLALRVWREERLLVDPGSAAEASQAPFALRRGGRWDPLEQIISAETAPGGATLVVATRGEVEVDLRLTLQEELLIVDWSVRDCPAGQVLQQTLALAPAGNWYGFGHHEPLYWPLETGEMVLDPCAASNIRSPLWLTSGGLGVAVLTHEVMRLEFNAAGSGLFTWGVVDTPQSRFHLIIAEDVAQVRAKLVELVGKPGRRPARSTLARPIFSTWTQYGKTITQEQVLHYARDIRRHDFPAQVVQVDERWEVHHGDLIFDRAKFPDPGAMVDEIHALGYQATLWVCPFVNNNSVRFSQEYRSGYMVMNATRTAPALMRWWDGDAGLVDFSNPEAVTKYAANLQHLRDEFGWDGFKFDGGDARYQPTGADRGFHLPTTPSGYCDLYQQFMHDYAYDLAESRTAWLAQSLGNLAREGGKDTVWGLNNGLAAMVALGMYQGLLGYPYLIPDMIGGRIGTRDAGNPLPSAALFLRWTQASVLLPIMQYSWAPWNYDANTVDLTREYTRLHEDLTGYLDELTDRALATGEPLVRPLFLDSPRDAETYPIYDEYLLGEHLLAAPVLTPDSRRRVYLPAGEWINAWTEQTQRGPGWLPEREVPVHELPLWVRADRPDLAATVTARLRGMPKFAGGGRRG
ncbi:MAG TPA: TIM-barrel domain-containing protein [Armatimonadota bacterium]|jgi:alpha-glucosidase (family GH31 glycosyl hydrolase)